MVLSMFFTATQQLTCALADSIHTLPNRNTTPVENTNTNPTHKHSNTNSLGKKAKRLAHTTLHLLHSFILKK